MACTPEIKTETYGKYQMSYAIIKMIIDYLQVNKVVSMDQFPWMIFTEFIEFSD